MLAVGAFINYINITVAQQSSLLWLLQSSWVQGDTGLQHGNGLKIQIYIGLSSPDAVRTRYIPEGAETEIPFMAPSKMPQLQAASQILGLESCFQLWALNIWVVWVFEGLRFGDLGVKKSKCASSVLNAKLIVNAFTRNHFSSSPKESTKKSTNKSQQLSCNFFNLFGIASRRLLSIA